MSTKMIRTIARAKAKDERLSFRWEEGPEEDAHKALTAWADRVRDLPSSIDRRKRNLLYASMYANVPLSGFGVNQYTRSIQSTAAIALNVTQNAIDSLVAKVCKNDPRPMFTTVEGDYELREKVENADKYVDALFMDQAYYEETHPGCVLDTAIYGLGVSKCHVVDGQATVERRFCHEMIIDERTGMYGRLPRVGERKYYDKQELFDLYKRDKDKAWTKDLEHVIDGAGTSEDPDFADMDRDDTSEQVAVFEAYLDPPNGKGARIICIRGKTLDRREWTLGSPYNFLRPMVQMAGIYGIGCAEKIIGIQREINRIIRDIQLAMHLIAKPHWMVEASSNVFSQHLNNDIATIVKYSGGVPPHVYTPKAMDPETYQHLRFLYTTAYEILGVSQLSAQSQKPAGIDSAVGMRTYLNVETERFSQFVKATEAFASKNGKKTARVLGQGKPKELFTRPNGKGSCEIITWTTADVDRRPVQVYPTSKLPDTPAGRREYALELAQYGVADKDEIYEMLEWADTEAFAKRRLAARRNVERDIALMRKGKKVVRDAIGDHATAFAMVSDAYEEAKQDGLPPERLNYLRAYARACQEFLSKDPPPAPAMPPPGAPPPGDPALGPPPGDPALAGAPGAPPPVLPNVPMAPGVPV